MCLRKSLFFYAYKLSFRYVIRPFSVSISLESQLCILINCSKPKCRNMKERQEENHTSTPRQGPDFKPDLPLVSAQNMSRSGLPERSWRTGSRFLFLSSHVHKHILSIRYCRTEEDIVYRNVFNSQVTVFIWNTKDIHD